MIANRATKLNPVQLHLLKVFSINTNETDLGEIKMLLSDFYAKKIDEVSNKIWEDKGMKDEDIEKILQTHIRTPYK